MFFLTFLSIVTASPEPSWREGIKHASDRGLVALCAITGTTTRTRSAVLTPVQTTFQRARSAALFYLALSFCFALQLVFCLSFGLLIRVFWVTLKPRGTLGLHAAGRLRR